MLLLTVFTPTYNRAEFLKKCYQSLVEQTNHNFVWQIIDDGSTDGTRELIESYILENKIAIDYHLKENGGKASAINKSLDITDTKYWLCLDSDDYLFRDAIDNITSELDTIDYMDNVCGLFAVRSNSLGAPMKGVDVPENIEFANQLDLRYKYNVSPEYVQIYKSEIIKQYRFPMYEGEKFVTESWMQDQIDQKYVFKVIRKPLMVCEYLQDGLTNNYYRLILNNRRGFLDFYAQRVRLCKQWKQKIIAAIMYNAVYRLLEDKSVKKERNLIIKVTSIAGAVAVRKIKRRCGYV